MFAIIVAALISAPQDTPLDGKATFERMLTKYYSAKSIKGTIEFNQTVEGVGKSTILTTVQAQKPNLLFIEQTKTTGEKASFRAICDGKQLVFTAPPDWTNYRPGARMVFAEAPDSFSNAMDSFAVLMLDRQLASGLALYNPYEVVTFTKQIKNIRMEAEVTLSGTPAWRLSAEYGIGVGGPGTGERAAYAKAWFYVSKNFDFLGMVYQEILQGTNERTRQTIRYQITNQWIVNLVVDAPVDASLFRIQ